MLLLQGEQLLTEAFTKVELTYGLGLKASDPATRDKFYKLWNNAIPPSLFERLKHGIMGQNWEEMGNTFWLKQAVVRLLSPRIKTLICICSENRLFSAVMFSVCLDEADCTFCPWDVSFGIYPIVRCQWHLPSEPYRICPIQDLPHTGSAPCIRAVQLALFNLPQ